MNSPPLIEIMSNEKELQLVLKRVKSCTTTTMSTNTSELSKQNKKICCSYEYALRFLMKLNTTTIPNNNITQPPKYSTLRQRRDTNKRKTTAVFTVRRW